MTSCHGLRTEYFLVNGSLSSSDRLLLETDIENYMLSTALPASLLFILILLYFPSLPPCPPSLTSQHSRLDFRAGLRQVMTSGPCWLVAVGSSIPQGICVAWTAMMVVNLTQVQDIFY